MVQIFKVGDFILQNLIIRTISCVVFLLLNIVVFLISDRPKYQHRKKHLGGPALKHFVLFVGLGGLCFVRTNVRAFAGIKFTKHFIEFVHLETNQLFGSTSNVILTNLRPAFERVA